MGLKLVHENLFENVHLDSECLMTRTGEYGPMTINMCQMLGKCVCHSNDAGMFNIESYNNNINLQ